MLTAPATLAIFTMLALSSFAVFWAKIVRLPHTVFLVLLGIGLGILSGVPGFSFFHEFTLTPELLFFLLLPTLIFESAYNINARRMVEDTVPVLLLAVISLLISTTLIGATLYYILPFFGFTVPFLVTLIFGALISATDPVAVLALFKEFGAPRRLSLIFEGESLFNDATAVALFLVLLDIMLFGFHGSETAIEGIIAFTAMMFGGVLLGLIMGGAFAKMVGKTRESEIASITLTVVLAHLTFIVAEILSHHLAIGSFELPISPIIATTVASLVMGNYGRPKIHPRAEEFVEMLWGQLAFMANSLIFILIGILFVSAPIFTDPAMIAVVLITIVIVAGARALSIYPVVSTYNTFTTPERKLPKSWQHLLSWGSLRGALAVTMVLLIPETATVPGWDLSLSVRDFLLALTVGCIFATLFLKATTIRNFMNKLKLDTLTRTEEIEYQEARALIHHEVCDRLQTYTERGYINTEAADRLRTTHTNEYSDACHNIHELAKDPKHLLADRVLRIFAIGIERRHLKDLYHHNEVNEAVYRRLNGKLQLQLEAIEQGDLSPDMSIHTDGKDVFEHMAAFIRKHLKPETAVEKVENLFMYYRAQVILSRKVIKEITGIETAYAREIFTPEALERTTTLYQNFKEQSQKKMDGLLSTDTTITRPLSEQLAARSVYKIEEQLLEELFERSLITPKLHITLKEELMRH